MGISCGMSICRINRLQRACQMLHLHVQFSQCTIQQARMVWLLISDLLARIAVLPSSSAQVERFSTMIRVKAAHQNHLKTETL